MAKRLVRFYARNRKGRFVKSRPQGSIVYSQGWKSLQERRMRQQMERDKTPVVGYFVASLVLFLVGFFVATF